MLAANFSGCVPIERLMSAGMVVKMKKRAKFSFKVLRIPEEDTVKVFPSDRSNQSLNKGMRYRCIQD